MGSKLFNSNVEQEWKGNKNDTRSGAAIVVLPANKHGYRTQQFKENGDTKNIWIFIVLCSYDSYALFRDHQCYNLKFLLFNF